MKLRKPCYKFLSMLLSLVLFISIVPLNVFAEQGQTTQTAQDTVELPTKEGGQENETVSVTVTVTPNEDGTTTTTKETAEGGYETASGLTVDYTSTEVTQAPDQNSEETPAPAETQDGISTSNTSGELISAESHYTVENENQTYGAEGGSSTNITVSDGTNTPDITLDLITDGTAASDSVSDSAGGSTTTEPTHEGDHLKDEDPANYDQTTTTVTDRTATAEIKDITTQTGDPARTPTESPGNEEQTDGTQTTVPENDGYHYFYKGANLTGNMRNYTIEYQWYDDGNNPIGNPTTVTGDYVYNLSAEYQNPDDPENSGEIIGNLYCMDMSTSAVSGAAYRKVNLEDAVAEGYYTSNQVSQLRAIMNNGLIMNYPFNDNGAPINQTESYPSSAQDLTAFIERVKNATGIEYEDLTWEQAAVATQMAIWTIANRETPTTEELNSGASKLKLTATSQNLNEAQVINELVEYLLSLSDNGLDSSGQKKETQIITEERFIDDLQMVIGDKVSDGATSDSDTYQVGLKFSLVVTPGSEDDLKIIVFDQNGNPVTSAKIPTSDAQAEGNEYAQKLVGDDGKIYYLLDGLRLQENSDIVFSLKLEGFQYLEKGVYVFESRKNADQTSSSQNLIGISEGASVVDVSTNVKLSFSVEESTITKTREWRREWIEYPVAPQDDDREIPEDKETPEDEETPEDKKSSNDSKTAPETISYRNITYVGTAPKTGDSSQTALYAAVLLLCISSFCGLSILRKKKAR